MYLHMQNSFFCYKGILQRFHSLFQSSASATWPRPCKKGRGTAGVCRKPLHEPAQACVATHCSATLQVTLEFTQLISKKHQLCDVCIA